MSILFSRIIYTAIILLVAYFALVKVWTKEVDILKLFKKPSESILVKDSGVVVNPNQLDLTIADWDKTQVFEIQNINTADTLYSIWIKIWSNTPLASLSDVDVLSENKNEFISANVGNLNVNFEVVKLFALDANTKPCIYLLIYRLAARESKFFQIKRSRGRQNETSPLNLLLEMKSFSNKPAPIAEREKGAAIQIRPPESCKIKSISFLLKNK